MVSCLCVTEDRSAFLPWLLWNYDRQAWCERELVIVASSTDALDVPDRPDIRVIRVPHRLGVGAKRNIALDEARGDAVAWFDDDDWQHPRRLHEIVASLDAGAPYVGQVQGWFVDLRGRRCARYRGGSVIIFNGAGFAIDVARRARFDETKRRGTDTIWLRMLRSSTASAGQRAGGIEWSAWLCHERNLSNPAIRRRFPLSLEELRRRMGPAWEGTDQALSALSTRLGYASADASAPTEPPCAAALAPVGERGTVHTVRAGFERPKVRSLRADVLAAAGATGTASPEPRTTAHPVSRVLYRAPDRGVAPLAVVIPVRNRTGAHVRNALASLDWQTAGRASQITVVSHGSTHATDAELERVCREFNASLIAVGSEGEPWSKDLASNTGIRASDPALAFVMMMDVETILAPDFVEHVLGELRQHPETLVVCRSTDLARSARIPTTPDRLRASFHALRRRGRLRRASGAGGVQAAARRFFSDAGPSDLLARATVAGLRIAWISDRTCMLHQWHSKSAQPDPRAGRRAAVARRTKHYLAEGVLR